MRARILLYTFIGCLIGIAAWYIAHQQYNLQMLLHFLPFASLVSFMLTITCVWLIPAVLVAYVEARQTQHSWSPALAVACFWTTMVTTYYFCYGVVIAITGAGQLEFLRIVNATNPDVLDDWSQFFIWSVISNITEWLPVAIIGGGVVGWFVARIYTRLRSLRSQASDRNNTLN